MGKVGEEVGFVLCNFGIHVFVPALPLGEAMLGSAESC